jgi:uncharacterized protein (UPF0264 family)
MLVSIRDLAEFSAVRAAAVDIIDWKEPQDGPLAPVKPTLWNDAVRITAGGEPPANPPTVSTPTPLLSAALGEPDQAISIAADVPPGFRFAKVGPSGCDDAARLRRAWSAVRQSLHPTVELIAVAYADWQPAGCLQPAEILDLAAAAGFRRCLLDTFVKDGRSSFDHLGRSGIARFAERARHGRIWWTLAGSIRLSDWPTIQQLHLRPDCIGLRGDLCRSGRSSRLAPERIAEWRQTMRRCESRETDDRNRGAETAANDRTG